jgi:hypothetical protein
MNYKVDRNVLQGAVSTIFGSHNIATGGCATCVGVACSGNSKTVAHFDCAYQLPKTSAKVEEIKKQTREILEEYFSEGKTYDWGYVTTSNDYTTKAIIEACKEFFTENPIINSPNIGIIIKRDGQMKALGWGDEIEPAKEGRNVDNKSASITKKVI